MIVRRLESTQGCWAGGTRRWRGVRRKAEGVAATAGDSSNQALLTAVLASQSVPLVVYRNQCSPACEGQGAGQCTAKHSGHGRCGDSASSGQLLPPLWPGHHHTSVVQPNNELTPCAYLASVARHAVWLHLRHPIPYSCLQGSAQRPSVTPVGAEREPLQTRHLVPVASHWAPEGEEGGSDTKRVGIGRGWWRQRGEHWGAFGDD